MVDLSHTQSRSLSKVGPQHITFPDIHPVNEAYLYISIIYRLSDRGTALLWPAELPHRFAHSQEEMRDYNSGTGDGLQS